MAAQVLPVDGLRLVKMLQLCFMKLQLELEPETKILHTYFHFNVPYNECKTIILWT